MPLAIIDDERADFTSASNVRVNRDKTAGEFVERVADLPNPATVVGARDRILRFGGIQGRPTAADPTVYIDVQDGTNQAGYTTYGIDATGKKPQKVVGQACVFNIRVSKAPVTGERTVAGRTGGFIKELDYATGAGGREQGSCTGKRRVLHDARLQAEGRAVHGEKANPFPFGRPEDGPRQDARQLWPTGGGAIIDADLW